MNKNVIALPYWANEILETLKCKEFNTIFFGSKRLYFGANPIHTIVVSEEVNDEGKLIYALSYSRRDCLKRSDKDKNAIAKCLTPLLGEPIASYEGEDCDFLEFNRKVN